MGGKSDYLELKVLNWIRGTAFGAAPGTVYVGLFVGDPTDNGAGGAEITTNIAAARVAVTFGAPVGNAISNSALVDFGAADGDADAEGDPVTHFGIFDAAAAGNLLGSAALTNPQVISEGNLVEFPIGSLVWTEE